jgi:hypothetical protein
MKHCADDILCYGHYSHYRLLQVLQYPYCSTTVGSPGFADDNLLQWNTNMTQLLGSKGLLGYIDGTISQPEPEKPKATTSSEEAETTVPPATPIYSSNPTFDEWVFRDHLARGHLTLNCTDLSSLGVNTSGTAKEAWDSIQAEWGKSTDMRRSHAQEALNRTLFVEGTEIQDHVKLLRS